jgi:drug/metabolite transporter (DMT)-like permease
MTFPVRLAPPLFVFLWATGFIGARYAMPWAEPFGFLAVRFVIAFMLLMLIAALLRSRRLTPRETLHSIGAGALMHGAYLGGVFWAIRQGMPSGIAAIIVGLQPLITAVMAGQVLRERILPRHWLGLVIGFVGVLIVLSPRFGSVGAGINGATVAAALAGVVAISAGTVWQKRFAGGVDLVRGACWQYCGAAAVTGLGAALFETGDYLLTGELVFAMAWLVLVLSIGAVLLLMLMIRQGEMSKVASLMYLVPAVTAVIAWALFGEALTLVQVAGMAVVMVGVAMATAQPVTRARASK